MCIITAALLIYYTIPTSERDPPHTQAIKSSYNNTVPSSSTLLLSTVTLLSVMLNAAMQPGARTVAAAVAAHTHVLDAQCCVAV